jgi:hypothetical protein
MRLCVLNVAKDATFAQFAGFLSRRSMAALLQWNFASLKNALNLALSVPKNKPLKMNAFQMPVSGGFGFSLMSPWKINQFQLFVIVSSCCHGSKTPRCHTV